MYVAQFFFAKIFWKRTSTVLYVFILQKNLNEQDLPPKYFWTNFNQTGKCETNPTSPNTVHGSLFCSHSIHSEQISRVVPRHFEIETCPFLKDVGFEGLSSDLPNRSNKRKRSWDHAGGDFQVDLFQSILSKWPKVYYK